VPWSRPGLQLEHLLSDQLDSVLRDRSQLSPETIEILPVESASASLEPAGIDEVRGPDLADVDLQLLVAAGEKARRARVVEVDVREQQVAKVPEGEPVGRQAGLQRIDAGRRPTVDKRGLVPWQQVRRDDPGVAEEVEIEELRAVT
jgi:hypothetical protein